MKTESWCKIEHLSGAPLQQKLMKTCVTLDDDLVLILSRLLSFQLPTFWLPYGVDAETCSKWSLDAVGSDRMNTVSTKITWSHMRAMKINNFGTMIRKLTC